MNPLAPVLQQEAKALLNTADQLQPDQAEAALNLLQHCSEQGAKLVVTGVGKSCLLYTSPSPRDRQKSRMPSSA